MKEELQVKKGWVDKFLAGVEYAGNALPHPATLFAILAAIVVILSAVLSYFGVSAEHPAKEGEIIEVFNLLSVEGLHMMMTKLVTNFTGFAPLGVVLVAMLGIGIAEGSGLIGAAIRLLVLKSRPSIITFVVVLAGVLSNTASEVGYVLLVPLAAIIFHAFGRHPIAGLAAAFAGVSGGYSANLLLGTVDPLLSGISQEAAQILDPNYLVNPAANYYFMAVSTFFIAIAGTFVTDKIVEPRLGKYTGDEELEEIKQLTSAERKGLLYALFVVIFFVIIILAGMVPADGFLRDLDPTVGVLRSPFMKGIVTVIFLVAALSGIAYGVGAGTIKSDADVMKGMADSMKQLGGYIVLVFFAAQFVAYFKWTNLGLILAIQGAEMLKALNVGTIPVLIGFIVLTALVNLIMGSASAKWTLMAPVFIPMFMLNGISPELTQVVYRIGDSVTNIISPMMSYFALIVAFIQKYDKNAGIGTVIATMLPYTIVFMLIWMVILIIWFMLGIEIGPESPLFYQP
ncbi:AbgT family transporter [Sediminitomix flava]|uniref:Aminobenzoyl-glutamate transport protein n=1 Tax=Sediminitomix flava TaxID=379075 RepID=A0A316A4F1_SEDFL|nr:AbgT family transporter [Sediminitomix flava]PWJ44617.1 aminobenzoyl-glutamate transport protein [Sediminitomix flava]